MGKISEVIEKGIKTYFEVLKQQYFVLIKDVKISTSSYTEDEGRSLCYVFKLLSTKIFKNVFILGAKLSESLKIIFGNFPYDHSFYAEHMINIKHAMNELINPNDATACIIKCLDLLPIASVDY